MVNRSHKPIKRIIDQIGDLLSPSQQNELEQISFAISLLMKRNKSLLDVVDSNNAELRRKFINDLLNNRLTPSQTEYGIHAYFKNSSELMPLQCMIISIDNYTSESDIEISTDAHTYYNLIKSLFDDEFGYARFMHFTSVVPSTYCVLLSVSDASLLKSRLQHIFLKAENDMGINLLATIGDEVPRWEDLPKVFSAVYFTHTFSVSGRSPYSVVSNNDLEMPFFYSSELDEQIYKACINSDKQALEQNISIIISKNFPSKEMFVKNNPPLSILLYALCTRILATLNISAEEIFGDEYNIYLEFKSCKSRDEFYKKALNIFTGIIYYSSKTKSNYENSYCEQMLSFVHNNYQNNISLTDIAEYMNMSQAYVSRLFKKLVHCNFKDYLVKVRLDNAVKLLIDEPNKTVAVVAAECGFNTTRTFTNAFSAAFGMTPTEYRHKHL